MHSSNTVQSISPAFQLKTNHASDGVYEISTAQKTDDAHQMMLTYNKSPKQICNVATR